MKIRFSYGFTTVSPILKTWHMANKPLFEKKSSIPNSTIYGFQPFIFGVLPCLGQTHDSYPVRLRLNPAQSDPDPDLLQTGHKVCALGYSSLTVRPVKDVGYFKRNQNIQCICGCFCVFKLPHPHHPVKKTVRKATRVQFSKLISCSFQN